MTVYYVTQGAAGGGAGTSEGDPWTLNEAALGVLAGDKVYVKADADYTTLVTNAILYTTVNGTNSNPIEWEGYTTTPGDGGFVTIDATAASYGVGASTARNYQIIKNFIVKNAGINGFHSAAGNFWTLINCQAHDNGTDGFQCDDGSKFYNCLSYANGGSGFDNDADSVYVNCHAYNNTSYGFYNLSGATYYNCISTGNGSSAFRGNPIMGFNCTADGNAKAQTGYQGGSAAPNTLVNCIVENCATGITMTTGTAANSAGQGAFIINVGEYNNTAVYNTTYTKSTDPINLLNAASSMCTDLVNDDATLSSGSEAIDAGIDGSDIPVAG